MSVSWRDIRVWCSWGDGRGYHGLMSSFGKVFHVEKRWKLIRELGSGAYGFVMYVVRGYEAGAVADCE